MNRVSIAEQVVLNNQDKEEALKRGVNLYVADEVFLRRFWDEKLNLPSNKVSVRVDRRHFIYSIDENGEIIQSRGQFSGFGGRKFTIEFFDGRIVETTNLWYQGEIPTDYDESLPDNARFTEEFKWTTDGFL